MSTRRFPRSPEITPRPFDGGPNPFADGAGANELPTPASNPYRTTVDESVQPYTPVEYVRSLPNRSATVLRLGIFGAVLSGLSFLLGIIILVTANWEVMVFCLPMGLIGVAFAIPAWTMGHADFRAIRAGAMDERGERATWIAWRLGCAATIVGLMPTVAGISAIVAAMFS